MNDRTYEDPSSLTRAREARYLDYIERRHKQHYPELYWHNGRSDGPNSPDLPDPALSMVAAVERMTETQRRWQAIADREGCCGGDPHGDGFCWNIRGMCPRIEEAARAVRFCEALIEYLDLLNIEVQPEEACLLQ